MSALASPSPAYAFAASPCGGLRTRLNGAAVTLRASGALWLEEQRTLVVADLHLEKGSAYAMRGQMLPPYDTRETLRRLQAEVMATLPDAVVLLGDTFHDRKSEDRLARDDAQTLRSLAGATRLIWVIGNHDADGPRALPGDVADELSVAGLTLRHEPVEGPQVGEVAGHLHPCARVVASRGSVRRRCFVTDGSRMVVPAFGAYAGGLNIRDAAFAGLFSQPPLCGALGADRVHAVGWRSVAGD
ncbi:ligase-associated DNA damage response endonuclease PdeM [Phenylobacterium sp.]|uniref:ligase-associated DNA damage response endonuclease PdeM n=1 Tax=Phenylobacterium sp. TaxID=1871053 RepID=UPI00272EF327|nr:ligase-associated DNA damage response endonuclease PdeM [Phenylobacterium sp.]MDP1599076.1 ligase-associated DNA damage response endonuclease PdeM [Phenylobacterium sp.]MDP3591725.1 ligase-associated DNA damage response endonuclease PdeM [Phenylobacterium sp.]